VAAPGNGLVAQSGGPTAVINSSVCGVVQGWQKVNSGSLYGALYGIMGVLEESFIDLTKQSSSIIEGLKNTPGAALGSCRYKVKSETDYHQLLSVFKKHDIRYFFYIGGNDSMDTADTVNRLAQAEGYEMKVIGIPKTVDNDLPFTDHCPGYGSAAKYLATVVLNTGIDLNSLITTNSIVVMEAMGRNTGWLAAASALAKSQENDPPHLICLPEVPFYRERFLIDVSEKYRDLGCLYIVASEGLVDENGRYLLAKDDLDSFGHVQLGGVADALKALIEKELELKVRCNVLGTVQRSAMHFASKVDAEEAYLVGQQAVALAVRGESGQMVTLERVEEDYLCKTGSIELYRVANVEKKMPPEMISTNGFGVNDIFIHYARPLIRGEISLSTKNGLPQYVSLTDHISRKAI
jgi:ATP-dependent phosphofructokinase / diphosphate-dependent phosphofructokinase